MRDAARIQAVIEVLENILKDMLPADQILDKYFKDRRYIGSKDRKFIADFSWKIIRNRLKATEALGGKHNVTPRLLVAYFLLDDDTELLFSGVDYAPALLSKEEKDFLKRAKNFEDFSDYAMWECPKWLADKVNNDRLLEVLNTTAPVDVRVNLTSREHAIDRLKKEGLFLAQTPISPIGLRADRRINLNNCMTYQDGEIEVMDEGSQLISLLCNVKKHHKIIDYCAGAGGKSLLFGAQLNNEGVIYAHDISQERLSRIKKRAERLDILNIKTIREVRDTDYSRFIIDAPCSGSGVWRRSPDAKFRMSPERLNEICASQAEILDFGATHTADNGLLIYMTCSILKEENEEQITKFLERHPNFELVNHRELWETVLDTSFYPFDGEKWLKLSPLNTKTDGFFFCAMRKK